jgi:hypothetical protein
MSDHVDRSHIIDRARSAGLFDVGSLLYDAATIVDSDGAEHLALVSRSSVGDATVGFSLEPPAHECEGPLPPDVVQRIAIRQPTTPPDERTELEP